MKTHTTTTSLQATWGRAGTLLLTCMLFYAGGGSSGGGNAANVSASAPTSATQPSLQAQITATENTGTYPKLDCSADMAGPDGNANGNGVRDDIEAWIHAQPVTDAQKKTLLQDSWA